MKLGYQQGDHLAYWWIDNYVNVSDAQEPPTRDAIGRFFAWHRKDQLPEIATLLKQVRAEVQQPVSEAEVAKLQGETQRLARIAYDRAIPDVADLLLTLKPEQIARMEKKFGDANNKYRKQFLRGTPDDRLSARYDKVMDYAKLIYGSFTHEQEARIREALRPVIDGTEARFDERVKRQQAWLALARQVQAEHPPKARVIEMLNSFGDQWQVPPTPERQARHDATNKAAVTLAVTIANLTTPEQKQHAVDRFRKWIDDTNALIREGPARPPARAQN